MENTKSDAQELLPDLLVPSMKPEVSRGCGALALLLFLVGSGFSLIYLDKIRSLGWSGLNLLLLLAPLGHAVYSGLISPPRHAAVDLRATPRGLFVGAQEILVWNEVVEYQKVLWGLKFFLHRGDSAKVRLIDFWPEDREKLFRRIDHELARAAA